MRGGVTPSDATALGRSGQRLGFDQLAIERFGFEEAPAIWKTDAFARQQLEYLDYHRREVFVS